jgi:hypothetical protein
MSDTKIIIQTPKPTEAEIAEFRKRTLEMADRSYINDRLNVPLPPDMHGEWIGTDDHSQYNAMIRGFVDGAEYLTNINKIHEQATGSSVGDVKFMVIPKWKQEVYLEAAQRESLRRSGFNGPVGEEDMFKQQASQAGLGVINDERPSTKSISGVELESQLKR